MGSGRARGAVVVAGVGIVTTAGRGAAATMAALRSGGRPPVPPRSIESPLAERFPVFEVPDAAFEDPPLRLPGGRGRRAVRLALLAAEEALRDAGDLLPGARTAVVCGGTVGGMNGTERWVEREAGGGGPAVAIRPALRNLPLWEAPAQVARRFRLRGPVTAVATACTSGTQAVAAGAELLLAGAADAVLAGGVDVLSRLTYHGFASLGLLSPVRCTPFDGGRSGLNLGEGAAFLLLVRPDAGLRPRAWLRGWASTSDAHHATAPRPDGSGVAAAMAGALAMAGLEARDLGWVHAHGTGTPNNDGVEAAAVRAVLGAAPPPVSGTKHVFGHTLGAAGAVAAAVAILAMEGAHVPGNAPIERPDPACDLPIVPPGGRDGPLGAVLVNSLGFGGTNASLVLSREAP